MISGSRRSPGEGNGNPLQYSWLVTVHGVARVRHDLATKPPLPPFPYIPVMSLLPSLGSYCKMATFGAGSGKRWQQARDEGSSQSGVTCWRKQPMDFSIRKEDALIIPVISKDSLICIDDAVDGKGDEERGRVSHWG